MTTMSDWALLYRSMGLSIFPVQAGEKLPLIKWKEFQTRLPNEEEIKTWWTQWPEADIGCVTGNISDRFVLDVDGETGKQSIEGRDLCGGLRVRTRNGFQYHYRMVDKSYPTTTLANILPNKTDPSKSGGVDVRGEGGYVKLPPSKCSDGSRYEWLDNLNAPRVEAPGWLVELLDREPTKATAVQVEHWLADIIDGVGDGERHAAMVRLAGYYFNVFPRDIACSHLRSWNEKNTPPIEEGEFEEQLQDLKERFSKGEYDSTYTESTVRVPELLSATTLTTKYSRAPEYLVPGFIPKATRTILAGWQGRGKSYAMTDLVIEIARKHGEGKWLGTFPVKNGPVFYVDNENAPNLVSWRVRQLLAPKKMTTDELDLHFVIGQHWKMDNTKDYAWLREQVAAIRPVLVVVDSFASCNSLDENDKTAMRYFFDDLVAPFCEEFQCGFLCIDHERKDDFGVAGGKRLRGSGAKGDAVDTILSLNEDKDGKVFLEHSKNRYGRKQAPFGIELEYLTDGTRLKANV